MSCTQILGVWLICLLLLKNYSVIKNEYIWLLGKNFETNEALSAMRASDSAVTNQNTHLSLAVKICAIDCALVSCVHIPRGLKENYLALSAAGLDLFSSVLFP